MLSQYLLHLSTQREPSHPGFVPQLLDLPRDMHHSGDILYQKVYLYETIRQDSFGL
jgi:hypothetical protein